MSRIYSVVIIGTGKIATVL